MAILNSTDPSWNGVVPPPKARPQPSGLPKVVPPNVGGTRTFEGKPLFQRQWRVTIDNIEITGLDVQFKIEKSTKDIPNKCELSVWNLQEDHRSQIEALIPKTKTVSATLKKKARQAARKQATKGIPVRIEAGYGDDPDDMSLLWLGDLRTADSRREGPDWITKLESGDGEKAYQNARINVSYGPKTPVATALRAMVKALTVGEGNLAAILPSVQVEFVGAIYPHGMVFSGPVVRHLNDFARSAGLEWSIQNSTLQILNRGEPVNLPAFKLSAATGMLDSPTVDVDGILTVKTLLIPGIAAGRLIVMDAERVKGNYRIDKITYTGDSAGSDWGVEIQASGY